MRRALDHPAARIMAIVILVIIVIITASQMYRRANRPGGYDFTSYLLSARALVQGENPYRTETRFPYIYPLTLATLLIPFTYLPYWLANGLWFLMNLGALWIALRLMRCMAIDIGKIPRARSLLPVITVLLLLTYNLLQNHFLNGQVNLVVLLCILVFFTQYRRGHGFLAGAALAMAIALKIMPALLLLFLAMRRAWKVMGYTLLATALLVFLPYPLLGSKLWVFYGHYIDSFWVERLLAPDPIVTPRLAYSLGATFAWIAGRASASPVLQALGMAAVLGSLLWIDARERFNEMGTFQLYLLAMLLISPMSEMHHLVFMLPALVLLMLWVHAGQRRLPQSTLWLLPASIVALVAGNAFKSGPLICLALLFLAAAEVRALRVDISGR